jgi:hypothetical protein
MPHILPLTAQRAILSFIPDASTLLLAGCVCTLWHNLSLDETLWKSFCVMKWPSTAALRLPSFTSFYRSRVVAEKNEAPSTPCTKLKDITVLLDVYGHDIREQGSPRIALASHITSLEDLYEGNLTTDALIIDWAEAALDPRNTLLSLDILFLRQTDKKTLVVTKQAVEVKTMDGRTDMIFFHCHQVSMTEQWVPSGTDENEYYAPRLHVDIQAPVADQRTHSDQPAPRWSCLGCSYCTVCTHAPPASIAISKSTKWRINIDLQFQVEITYRDIEECGNDDVENALDFLRWEPTS